MKPKHIDKNDRKSLEIDIEWHFVLCANSSSQKLFFLYNKSQGNTSNAYQLMCAIYAKLCFNRYNIPNVIPKY